MAEAYVSKSSIPTSAAPKVELRAQQAVAKEIFIYNFEKFRAEVITSQMKGGSKLTKIVSHNSCISESFSRRVVYGLIQSPDWKEIAKAICYIAAVSIVMIGGTIVSIIHFKKIFSVILAKVVKKGPYVYVSSKTKYVMAGSRTIFPSSADAQKMKKQFFKGKNLVPKVQFDQELQKLNLNIWQFNYIRRAINILNNFSVAHIKIVQKYGTAIFLGIILVIACCCWLFLLLSHLKRILPKEKVIVFEKKLQQYDKQVGTNEKNQIVDPITQEAIPDVNKTHVVKACNYFWNIQNCLYALFTRDLPRNHDPLLLPDPIYPIDNSNPQNPQPKMLSREQSDALVTHICDFFDISPKDLQNCWDCKITESEIEEIDKKLLDRSGVLKDEIPLIVEQYAALITNHKFLALLILCKKFITIQTRYFTASRTDVLAGIGMRRIMFLLRKHESMDSILKKLFSLDLLVIPTTIQREELFNELADPFMRRALLCRILWRLAEANADPQFLQLFADKIKSEDPQIMSFCKEDTEKVFFKIEDFFVQSSQEFIVEKHKMIHQKLAQKRIAKFMALVPEKLKNDPFFDPLKGM